MPEETPTQAKLRYFHTLYRLIWGRSSAAVISCFRLLLIDFVGEACQRELLGLWAEGQSADAIEPGHDHEPYPQEKKIQYFHTLYRFIWNHPEANAAVISCFRLLLIDCVGEARQRELLGEWQAEAEVMAEAVAESEPAQARSEGSQRYLLAQDLASAFAEAGMPFEWACRFSYLFQTMPPLMDGLDRTGCLARREEERASGDYAWARIRGNYLIADAIARGDLDDTVRHVTQNCEIYEAWEAAEPAVRRERADEFEEHAWLRAHCAEMVGWSRRVYRQLEIFSR